MRNDHLLKNTLCDVIIPSNGPGWPTHAFNTYNVQGTIFFHTRHSSSSEYRLTNCIGRGPCLQVGDLTGSNDYINDAIRGLSFRTPTDLSSNPAFAGVGITQTQRTSQVVTITTSAAHGFRVGDMVTLMFTDSSSDWGATRSLLRSKSYNISVYAQRHRHCSADDAGRGGARL